MDYQKITFPDNFEYSSDGDDIPLDFYLDVLPCSKEIYLKLGYFSSKAIQVLAYGFAQFIHNGGRLKIVTIHFLYENDIDLLEVSSEQLEERLNERFFRDLSWIRDSLLGTTQHFMDCLRFLVANGRLEIVPVLLLPSRMAHYKQGVFIDGSNNSIFIEGSCNFTANGLLENAESLSIYRSWGTDFEKNKINGKKQEIAKIVSKENEDYKYLISDHILNAVDSIGRDKSVVELLHSELDLLRKNTYKEKIKETL